MRNRLSAVAGAAVLLAATVAGCSTGADPTSSESASSPGASSPAPSTGVPAEAAQILAEHGLEGLDPVEIIDRLDRLGGEERPADLMASVRPGELQLSSGEDEVSLDLPDDAFYLSVAPYVDQTHECFYHSLTTCKGELGSKEVRVKVVDRADGAVLVDETRTTFANGFTGFWLPRGIEGALEVTYEGREGELDFATDDDAPTCETTMRLA